MTRIRFKKCIIVITCMLIICSPISNSKQLQNSVNVQYTQEQKNDMKFKAANAAIKYLASNPEKYKVIGVGTGTTVNYFIDLLPTIRSQITTTVASSIATKKRLQQHGFTVVDLNEVDDLAIYIDGADSYNQDKQLIKGGGGALTREKIIAAASKEFICITDNSKESSVLGKFPVPVEIIPMAKNLVASEIIKLKGKPVLRENFITDNGNIILDVHDWEIDEPRFLEKELNNITGVVSNGVFALRKADLIFIASPETYKTL